MPPIDWQMSIHSCDPGAQAIKSGNDPIVRAAWLYYAEQRTQAEIATALGISRATVANHLAQARQSGLVSVRLDPDLLRSVSQAKALEASFELTAAHVIPSLPQDSGDPAGLRARLGRAAANVLVEMLSPDMVLGVAWGRTMADLAQALPNKVMPRLRVVQISGSSLGDEATSPEACTVHIATRLGAHCHNFHAPAVVSTTHLRDLLMQEAPLAHHFRRVQSCSALVFGVGELTEDTRWADGDQMIRPVAADYLAQGSVGILIGRFIDSNGSAVSGPLSGRQIGMELDDLGRIEIRLCVAGGIAKAPAIRATLAGRYITHLITDSATAELLLEE